MSTIKETVEKNAAEINRAFKGRDPLELPKAPRRMMFVDEAPAPKTVTAGFEGKLEKPKFLDTLAAAAKALDISPAGVIDLGAKMIEFAGATVTSVAHSSVRLDKLIESTTNPRKTFIGIDALAVSLKAQGMISPLVVRLIENQPVEKYEVICGARRMRAAKVAGLESVPVAVVQVSDAQVLELQATENFQREGLTPIEEAESFSMLLSLGYTVDQVAARIGTSASTVRGRVKLLELGPEAKVLIAEGKLSPSTGTVLARSCPTHKMQADFLKKYKVAEGTERGDTRALITALQSDYTTSLARAPFSLKDAALIGGACVKCPKNARNGAPGLFDDLGTPRDICTDVFCYRAKVKEALNDKASAAKQEGLEVMRGEDARAALAPGSDFVKLGEQNHMMHGKKLTWGEHLDNLPTDKRPDVVLALDEKTGEAVKLVSRKAVTKAVAATSTAKWARAVVEDEEQRKVTKAKMREVAAASEHNEAVTRDVAMAIAKVKRTQEEDRKVLFALTVRMLLEIAYLTDDELESLGFEDIEAVEKKLKTASLFEMERFVFALAVMRSAVAADFVADGGKEFPTLAKRFGVDLEHFRKTRQNTAAAEAVMKGKKP